MNLVLPCQTFLLALLVSLEPSQLGLCTFSGGDLHYCKPSKITDEFVFCWQLVHFTPVSSLIGLFLAGMSNDHLQKFLNGQHTLDHTVYRPTEKCPPNLMLQLQTVVTTQIFTFLHH